MKRIFKVLAATALMMVLMATTVSPAFAGPHQRELPGNDDNPRSTDNNGWGAGVGGCIQRYTGQGGNDNCGWGPNPYG